MLINEVVSKIGMTKRAIKFYEEKGLIDVKKKDNGYRDYRKEDIEKLRMISVYRKLGIGLEDIKELLKSGNEKLLHSIYNEKIQEHSFMKSELESLKRFIEDGNASQADEQLDYQTVMEAIESLLPGEWGVYFKNHFAPFLNIKISTEKQKSALAKLLSYCDSTTLRVPFLMNVSIKLSSMLQHNRKTAEEMMDQYRFKSEDEYQTLKNRVLQGVKAKNGIFKYHSIYMAQRKFQKELQNKGYNDIFIPNLRQLSPSYDEYQELLNQTNQRICMDLGLYYDENYNLVIKK